MKISNPYTTQIIAFNKFIGWLTANGYGTETVLAGDALSQAEGHPSSHRYDLPAYRSFKAVIERFACLRSLGFTLKIVKPEGNRKGWLSIDHPGDPVHFGVDRYDQAMMGLLALKLHPSVLQVSGKFTAILGFLIGEEFTCPAFTDLGITTDGFVLGQHKGEVGLSEFLGGRDELLANIDGVAEAVPLSQVEKDWLHHRIQKLSHSAMEYSS